MYTLPSSSKLNIASLAQLFNNTSECYKFFWFQAILNKLTVKTGSSASSTLTFDSLVNEMIVNAWFMVNEYHLNLGPADNLENVVKHLQDISGFQSNVKRDKLLSFIDNCGDERVKEYKKILISNVPYRLQAPFMSDFKGSAWHVGVKKLIEGINEHDGLIYKIGPYAGLATELHIDDAWVYYMEEHQNILDDWMKFNLISYLERRNPGVPGIINKLTPPEARDLKRVTDFWKTVMQHREITEIYKSQTMDASDVSIDHFVPWSYVSHDEFWNLSPTKKSINSAKSNNLPDWHVYFNAFCELHYQAYELLAERDVKHAFEKCLDKHLNDGNARIIWAREEQTKAEFCKSLEDIMTPVYQSAKRSGFGTISMF